MQIIRGPIPTAQRVIVYGPEGIGKSTLASQAPNPVFIDTEGSTRQYNFARFPEPTSWQMLMQQVDHVINNPDVCDTLVIDTADWAEKLAVQHILARDGQKSIEGYGYGKGYVYLEEEFGRLLNRLNDVIERGIHVVLVAHAHMRKFEQPDEAGSYDRWELKLQRRVAPLVKEWADVVLFCNYKIFVENVDGQGAQKGRNIAQGGRRVIHTTHSPVWDAKNRHGLPAEVEMDYKHISPVFTPRQQLQTSTPAPAPTTAPAPAAMPESSGGPFDEPAPAPEPTPETPATDELDAAGVPKALADLMRANEVTLEELMAAVFDRGHFPADTEFRNLPDDYVQGVLIAAWDQVLAVINEKIRTPF